MATDRGAVLFCRSGTPGIPENRPVPVSCSCNPKSPSVLRTVHRSLRADAVRSGKRDIRPENEPAPFHLFRGLTAMKPEGKSVPDNRYSWSGCDFLFFFLRKTSRLENTTSRIPLFHAFEKRMTGKNHTGLGNDNGGTACSPASVMAAVMK